MLIFIAKSFLLFTKRVPDDEVYPDCLDCNNEDPLEVVTLEASKKNGTKK